MRRLLATSLALALVACVARSWNDDETHRISDVMAGDRVDPDLPEARGIPLHQMPPQARPSPRSLSPEGGKEGRRIRVRPLTPPRDGVAASAPSRASRHERGTSARRRDRDRAPPRER